MSGDILTYPEDTAVSADAFVAVEQSVGNQVIRLRSKLEDRKVRATGSQTEVSLAAMALVGSAVAGTGEASKALILDATSNATLPASGRILPTYTRTTISDAATIADAEMAGGILFQSASGGNVTMTTRTGTQMAAAFPSMVVGSGRPLHVASNHASNTSTIAGGTDVTLVGSGAVTNLGGTFMLIKTAATTFDLVRVG